MRRTSMSWARPVSVVLAVLITIAGGVRPAAAEPVQSVKSYPAATKLSSTIAATVGSLQPTARAVVQASPDAGTADSPKSFFRTRTGVAAIVLMVAGVVYVGYSIPKDNEKVHSPIR